MRTKSAIIIMTSVILLTGCGSIDSEMKDSSDNDVTVEVDEQELCTTADTTQTFLSTTVSTFIHLVKTTELVTQTESELIYEDNLIEKQSESSTDVLVVEGNVCPVTGITLQYTSAYCICEKPLTAKAGVVWYGGHKETYYSENVLPGLGLAIPDRHHGDDGTIRDAEGYICVAADYSFLPYGSVVVTSLGPGKVYDTGCAWGTIDIYTCW